MWQIQAVFLIKIMSQKPGEKNIVHEKKPFLTKVEGWKQALLIKIDSSAPVLVRWINFSLHNLVW